MDDTFLEQRRSVSRREAWLLGLAFSFLALTCAALTVAPAARLGSWSGASLRWEHWVFMPFWFAAALFLHRRMPAALSQRDPFLLPIGLLLSGWGVLLVWRLTPSLGHRQAAWFIVAALALYVVLRAPLDLRWLRRYKYLWLTAGVVLAALTFLLGTHPTGSEPRLWLGCCGVYLQPSEPLRLLLVAFVASFLADRLPFGFESARSGSLIRPMAPLLLAWGLTVGLLVVQRDLGTGTLYLALFAVLLYIAFGRWQVLLLASALVALGAAIGSLGLEVIRVRLTAWLDPWQDPIGGSYQIVQALIAIASGGLLGRGPGMGSPGFVPVAMSDFIFAAAVEEWGVLGGLALIGLFCLFVTRGLRAAMNAQDPFGAILAAGLAIAIGMQTILISGGIVRLFPVTGVTLPFVSYGGSSLLTTFLALGLLVLLSSRTGGASTMVKNVRRVQLGLTIAWAAVAVGVGWWGLYRGPTLVLRTDNPRRAVMELTSKRGSILDRNGAVVAESLGERGGYQRFYASPAFAAVVGYDSPSYGLAGLEESLDDVLRGQTGWDAGDLAWSVLLTGAPPSGHDVRLTLDRRVQEAVSEGLQGYAGAVAVVDYLSGDVLAGVSAPSFDPNTLEDNWEELVSREDAPLLDRASQGRFQPGMALSPLMTAWALQEGLADPDRILRDLERRIRIDGGFVECAEPIPDHGTLGVETALRFGCPAPFAELAVAAGSQGLADLYRAFGLLRDPLTDKTVSSPVSVPMGAEALALAGVGQGEVTVSPLQMARAFAALANGGELPALKLVEAIEDAEGEWQLQAPSAEPSTAVSGEAASQVLAWLTASDKHVAALATEAVGGAQAGRLAWYFAITRLGSDSSVLVVVLEHASADEAQRVGQRILGLESSSGLP